MLTLHTSRYVTQKEVSDALPPGLSHLTLLSICPDVTSLGERPLLLIIKHITCPSLSRLSLHFMAPVTPDIVKVYVIIVCPPPPIKWNSHMSRGSVHYQIHSTEICKWHIIGINSFCGLNLLNPWPWKMYSWVERAKMFPPKCLGLAHIILIFWHIQ